MSDHITCCCLVAKLCLTLLQPIAYSPPGSFVHGIFQARMLEWVVISFSRGTSQPRDGLNLSLLLDRQVLYPRVTWEA